MIPGEVSIWRPPLRMVRLCGLPAYLWTSASPTVGLSRDRKHHAPESISWQAASMASSGVGCISTTSDVSRWYWTCHSMARVSRGGREVGNLRNLLRHHVEVISRYRAPGLHTHPPIWYKRHKRRQVGRRGFGLPAPLNRNTSPPLTVIPAAAHLEWRLPVTSAAAGICSPSIMMMHSED